MAQRKFYKQWEINKGARAAPSFDDVELIVLRCEHSFVRVATWKMITGVLASVYEQVLESGYVLEDEIEGLKVNDYHLPAICNPSRLLSYRIEDYGKTPLFVTYKPRDYSIPLSKVTLWNEALIAKSQRLPDKHKRIDEGVLTI